MRTVVGCERTSADRLGSTRDGALLVISLVFVGAEYLTVQRVGFELAATDSVKEVPSAPEYDRRTIDL